MPPSSYSSWPSLSAVVTFASDRLASALPHHFHSLRRSRSRVAGHCDSVCVLLVRSLLMLLLLDSCLCLLLATSQHVPFSFYSSVFYFFVVGCFLLVVFIVFSCFVLVVLFCGVFDLLLHLLHVLCDCSDIRIPAHYHVVAFCSFCSALHLPLLLTPPSPSLSRFHFIHLMLFMRPRLRFLVSNLVGSLSLCASLIVLPRTFS